MEGGGANGAYGWQFGGRGGKCMVYKPNSNKHKILCNSVKTSVIREKVYVKIEILELPRSYHNILEDS